MDVSVDGSSNEISRHVTMSTLCHPVSLVLAEFEDIPSTLEVASLLDACFFHPEAGVATCTDQEGTSYYFSWMRSRK